MEQWLEEIAESEELAALDIHPDVTLGDSLQGVQEVLTAYYPEGYTPPKKDPDLCIELTHPWQKLKNDIFITLSEISGVLIITAALSACTSLFCWGVSDFKGALGYKQQPDFTAQSNLYRGVAIASIGAALGCGVVGSVINEARK
jgi:hypothetical protein